MKTTDRGRALQDLERLFHRGTVPSSDRALLDAFVTEGSEAAFEALVDRHGPMVRGVCRRLLSNPHDADDAFQATFLVLARKGARIRDPDRLGPWLYGVALRVAAKARARAARRRENGGEIADVPAPVDSTAEWSDVMPIIDAELNRLRAKHRDVLVLCLIEGASAEEASHRLGCPVGTVKSRLARARETLRARLIGRGVAPAVALTALASSAALASPVPPTLTRATLQTITAKVVPPGVAALIAGVAPAMIWKTTLTTLALVGCVGLSAAYCSKPSPAQEQPPPVNAEAKDKATEVTDAMKRKVNNLKQIILAAHNYHSDKETFPPPWISGDRGSPLLSWRVALLPYLGQEELYKQFQLDEPWDSPNNFPLIEKMPAVFETPDAPAPKGLTRFCDLVGQGGTMFDPTLRTGIPSQGPRGVRLDEVTDGASNTAFVVVAQRPTVWTKPLGGAPFIPNRFSPPLDESDPRGIILGMVDGSVRPVSPKSSPQVFTALATRNGGEIIDWSNPGGVPQLANATQPALAEPEATPATNPEPALPPALEQRLKTVEEKLDHLLRKLDEAPRAGGFE